MPARGLTRRITKKQAKSYELTSPNSPRRARQNPLGVTAIAAVMNGRGSYANRYAATRELLQRGESMPSMQQNRRRHRARPNLTARQYEKEVEAERAKKTARVKRAKPARKSTRKPRAASAPSPAKRTLSSAQKEALSKGLAKWRKGQAKRLAAAHKKSLSKRFKRIPVHIGGKTVRSYAYRTPHGKVRKIPLWAIVGAKSKKDLAGRAASKKGVARRVAAAEKARKKKADRILLKGDLFTPNRRRRSNVRAIPYETWSDTMEMNPRRRRRRRATSNRISKVYKPKGMRGPGRHSKLTVKKAHKRKRTAKQRQATARMLAARWGGGFTQRRAWKNKRKTARKTRRKATAPRRKLYGAALKAWRKKRGLKVSGGHRRRARRNAAAATPNRRRHRKHARRNQMMYANRRRHRRSRHYNANQMYNANRRRHHSRRYRRNPDIMGGLMKALKTGAVVGLGFLAHRGLSHLLSMQLQKMATFAPAGATVGGTVTATAGSGAPYASLLGGAIVALAGIPLAAMVPGVGAQIGAGMVADFLYQALMTVLTVANQPNVAGYFSAYPDASGQAFHTLSSYEEMPPGFRGYGEYQMMPPGYGGFGAITQAAAGYGAITQAAAGYGAITQAAAGMGEYVAQGVQGYGEYEATNGFSGGYGAYGAMDEGIPGGNTYAAERALSVAEAAAGLGDATLVSTVNPDMIAAPIMDSPGGSRAGVFQGGDGIFG